VVASSSLIDLGSILLKLPQDEGNESGASSLSEATAKLIRIINLQLSGSTPEEILLLPEKLIFGQTFDLAVL
jgi:hypothetical protein